MTDIANLLSADLDDLARAICSSLGTNLDPGSRVMAGATLEDFRVGRAGVALVCGLAYSLLHDAAPGRFMPVAAPLIDDGRTGDAPVYFSEIVIPYESRTRDLEELYGGRFAYNETMSFSGYRALEHELATRGLSWDLFGERIQTGSHRASLMRIRKGEADAAAIDSQVLLLEKRRDPSLAGRMRVLASLGPYPAPPLAVNTGAFDAPVEQALGLLENLPQATLRNAGIRAWRPVDDAYYDAIRQATRGMLNPSCFVTE